MQYYDNFEGSLDGHTIEDLREDLQKMFADFLTLIRQVRKPDVKKKYKVIAIDTVENLYAFCDQ